MKKLAALLLIGLLITGCEIREAQAKPNIELMSEKEAIEEAKKHPKKYKTEKGEVENVRMPSRRKQKETLWL